VHEECIICTLVTGMAKGTSRAEATSNSKKIKPVALANVELRESVVENSNVFFFFFNSVALQRIAEFLQL